MVSPLGGVVLVGVISPFISLFSVIFSVLVVVEDTGCWDDTGWFLVVLPFSVEAEGGFVGGDVEDEG